MRDGYPARLYVRQVLEFTLPARFVTGLPSSRSFLVFFLVIVERALYGTGISTQRFIMKTHHFTVILYKEEDMYIAECPEVGTVDQGATIEEAIAGLREATKLYLEEFFH